MKKFFEKHDLFKLAGIVLLIAIIFSWIMSSTSFSEGALQTGDMTRVGLFDFTTYNLLGFWYFTVNLVFVLVVGGFYKFLGSLSAYRQLTDNIAKFFEGKEKIFVAISILIFACLAGITTEYFSLLALAPFVITILSKLKVDKVTGVASTFGGILVGILGSTYSTKITAVLVDTSYGLGVSYAFELVGIIVIFAIAYLLLTYFTFARMNSVKKDKEVELLEDPFITIEEVEKKSTKKKSVVKVKTLPLVIILFVLLLNLILGYIPWENAFNVTVFKKAFEWVSSATIANQEVYSYILGSSLSSFGNWDLLIFAGLMFIATLIIKIVYHIPFDNIIEEFGSGFKNISKSVVILLMVYSVLIFSILYPTIPTITNWIFSLGNNVFSLFFGAIFTSIFTVDFQYTVSMIGSVFANFSNLEVAALALQAGYGVISFIAPTSLVLMFGLSLLDVKFKDWLKYIWKFVIALLVIVIVVLAILMYI